jgi:hypothetical protein
LSKSAGLQWIFSSSRRSFGYGYEAVRIRVKHLLKKGPGTACVKMLCGPFLSGLGLMMVKGVEAAAGNSGQPTGSDVVLEHGQALLRRRARGFSQFVSSQSCYKKLSNFFFFRAAYK